MTYSRLRSLGIVLVLVFVAVGGARAQTLPAFTAVVDGTTSKYQAYLEYPTTGEVLTIALAMRLRAVPTSPTEFGVEWTDASTGAPVPDAEPYRVLPRRLALGSRGLSVDAYGTTLPASFERLAPRPARLRSGRVVAYARDALGCIELYSPGATDEAYRAIRACFASDGVLRDFFFDSANSSIELAGPVTLPSDIVGVWSGRDPLNDRSFVASLALDAGGRLTGTYVTTAAWATECVVVQIDDAQHPEAVSVHLRCEERLVGDEPSIEHAECAFSLVGGELVLDRCAVDAFPLRRTNVVPN